MAWSRHGSRVGDCVAWSEKPLPKKDYAAACTADEMNAHILGTLARRAMHAPSISPMPSLSTGPATIRREWVSPGTPTGVVLPHDAKTLARHRGWCRASAMFEPPCGVRRGDAPRKTHATPHMASPPSLQSMREAGARASTAAPCPCSRARTLAWCRLTASGPASRSDAGPTAHPPAPPGPQARCRRSWARAQAAVGGCTPWVAMSPASCAPSLPRMKPRASSPPLCPCFDVVVA